MTMSQGTPWRTRGTGSLEPLRSESPMTGGSVSSYPLEESSYSSDDENEVVSSGYPNGSSFQRTPQVSVSFGPFSVPMSPTIRTEGNGFVSQSDDDGNQIHILGDMLQTREYCHIVQDLERSGETVDEALLTRWVGAHGSSKDTAVLDKLLEHAAWRADFVGDGDPVGIMEESIQDILDAKIVFLQGNDGDGHPVLIFLAKRYDAQTFSRKLPRLLVYAMDGALLCADGHKNPKKQVTWIFDLDSVNRKNISVEFLESMFAIFQGHYPECLHKLYFLNAPFLFWAIWRCASTFVAAGTREKIEFVSVRASYNSPSVASKIEKSILPDVYGGISRWRPIEDSVGIVRKGGVLVRSNVPRTRSQQTTGRSWYTSSPVTIPEFSMRSIIFWILFIVGTILWIVLKMVSL
jgi:uncharacterized protein YndB with AHSA1/START domain